MTKAESIGHKPGDDLDFAQGFVDSTTAMMQSVFSQDNLPDSDDLSEQMTLIQAGAKTLRARAIYQGAQTVLQVLQSRPRSDSALAGRLLALNKLIVQYGNGLAEITEAADNISETTATSLTEPDDDSQNTTSSLSPAAQNYITAKQILAGVLDHATPSEAKQLTRLMTLNDRRSKATHTIELEGLMRDIIQDALSIARISGKTISISYDVRSAAIADDYKVKFQVAISRALRSMILETLPKEGVGHIDMIANKTELCIKTKGKPPSLLPQGARADTHNDITRVYLALMKDEAEEDAYAQNYEAPAPLITQANETAIREQLAQLMDPDAVLAEVGQ